MGLTSLTCYGWCRIRIAINQAWAMCLGHCRHSDTDNIVIVMLKFLLAKPGPQININPRVPWLFPNSEAKVSFASSLKVWSQRGHGSFSLSGTYRNSTLLLYSKLWNFPSKKRSLKIGMRAREMMQEKYHRLRPQTMSASTMRLLLHTQEQRTVSQEQRPSTTSSLWFLDQGSRVVRKVWTRWSTPLRTCTAWHVGYRAVSLSLSRWTLADGGRDRTFSSLFPVICIIQRRNMMGKKKELVS